MVSFPCSAVPDHARVATPRALAVPSRAVGAALTLRSEACEDAQSKHDCGVQVPEPCTGGIERPRECLINELQVESRAEPGGDRSIRDYQDL
jgi:hypothetical protein